MHPTELSAEARTLLKQLHANPCVGVFDKPAADELVARGLAAHIPATGTIEATHAARPSGDGGDGTGSRSSIRPDSPALPSIEMLGRTSGPDGVGMSGQGSDCCGDGDGFGHDDSLAMATPERGSPAEATGMGSGLGVNGTAGSEGASRVLKSNYDPASVRS